MAHESLHQPRLSAGFYTKYFLSIVYQRLVLGYNFSFVWKCPVDTVLLPFFLDNLSHRHLDCGVANGYLCAAALSSPQLPPESYQLTLLDLNPNCLDSARAAVLSKAPSTDVQCITTNIRGPLPKELEGVRYKSISMFNLFHCVPGGRAKFDAFRTFKNVLADDGVLTGSTILGKRNVYSWHAWFHMKFYNFMGIFNNWDDTKEQVEAALKEEVADVNVSVVGMVLLFRAKAPLRD